MDEQQAIESSRVIEYKPGFIGTDGACVTP